MDSSIFHSGSIHVIETCWASACGANGSATIHSQGYSLHSVRTTRCSMSTNLWLSASQPMSSMAIAAVTSPACSAVSWR